MFFCVVLFFVLFLFVIFIKISKFALPGVMLMYEQTSNERKKESDISRFLRSYRDMNHNIPQTLITSAFVGGEFSPSFLSP